MLHLLLIFPNGSSGSTCPKAALWRTQQEVAPLPCLLLLGFRRRLTWAAASSLQGRVLGGQQSSRWENPAGCYLPSCCFTNQCPPKYFGAVAKARPSSYPPSHQTFTLWVPAPPPPQEDLPIANSCSLFLPAGCGATKGGGALPGERAAARPPEPPAPQKADRGQPGRLRHFGNWEGAPRLAKAAFKGPCEKSERPLHGEGWASRGRGSVALWHLGRRAKGCWALEGRCCRPCLAAAPPPSDAAPSP